MKILSDLETKLKDLEDSLTTRKQQMKGLMIDVKHVAEDMEDLKDRAVQVTKAINLLKNKEEMTKSESKL